MFFFLSFLFSFSVFNILLFIFFFYSLHNFFDHSIFYLYNKKIFFILFIFILIIWEISHSIFLISNNSKSSFIFVNFISFESIYYLFHRFAFKKLVSVCLRSSTFFFFSIDFLWKKCNFFHFSETQIDFESIFRIFSSFCFIFMKNNSILLIDWLLWFLVLKHWIPQTWTYLTYLTYSRCLKWCLERGFIILY